MKKGYLKIKTKFSEADIQLMHRTAEVHVDSETEFGWFCAGVSIGLRSVFEDLLVVEGNKRYAPMTINKQAAAAVTNLLLITFDETKTDLVMAEVNRKDNRELSSEIVELAKRQKELAGQ